MKKIKNFIIENKRIIIASISIIVVIAILEDVFDGEIMKCDTIAYSIIMNLRNKWITPIMKIITNLGSAIALLSVSFASLIFVRNKKIGICITANLVIITILNLLLKNIVQRPRPEGYRIISELGYSFPSGHSMVSTASYGLIIYLIFKNVKNNKIKWTTGTLLGIITIAICFSRVYLGVHYASDVIAGFFTALAYLMLMTKITYKIINSKKDSI